MSLRSRIPPAAGILLVAAGLTASFCRPRVDPLMSAEKAVLERQVRGLQALVDRAAVGPIIPFEQVLVVLDQALVQDLMSAAMPFERVVADRYRIRVTRATVSFDDGFALVRLDGRASLADRADTDVFAEVSVFGGLNTMELDPASGVLQGKVDLIAFEARKVEVMGVGAPTRAEELVEDLGRQRIESFAVLASAVEVPVRLENQVTIPAAGGRDGEVRIEAAKVPFEVRVADLVALHGKLWVCVSAAAASSPPPKASARLGAPEGERLLPPRAKTPSRKTAGKPL